MLLKTEITSNTAESLNMTFLWHFIMKSWYLHLVSTEGVHTPHTIEQQAMDLSVRCYLKQGVSWHCLVGRVCNVCCYSPAETNPTETIYEQKACISKLLQLIKISVQSPHLAREYYPKDKQHTIKAQFLIAKQSFQSILGKTDTTQTEMEAEAFDISSPTVQWKLLYHADITENSAFCQQVSKCRSIPINVSLKSQRSRKWPLPHVTTMLTCHQLSTGQSTYYTRIRTKCTKETARRRRMKITPTRTSDQTLTWLLKHY